MELSPVGGLATLSPARAPAEAGDKVVAVVCTAATGGSAAVASGDAGAVGADVPGVVVPGEGVTGPGGTGGLTTGAGSVTSVIIQLPIKVTSAPAIVCCACCQPAKVYRFVPTTMECSAFNPSGDNAVATSPSLYHIVREGSESNTSGGSIEASEYE